MFDVPTKLAKITFINNESEQVTETMMLAHVDNHDILAVSEDHEELHFEWSDGDHEDGSLIGIQICDDLEQLRSFQMNYANYKLSEYIIQQINGGTSIKLLFSNVIRKALSHSILSMFHDRNSVHKMIVDLISDQT